MEKWVEVPREQRDINKHKAKGALERKNKNKNEFNHERNRHFVAGLVAEHHTA